MKLLGNTQAQDYRIQYDSIVRLFVLPKSFTPHTLVVISLDPPIRKGQTFYPHILVQLPTDEDLALDLEITDEQFKEKNEKVPLQRCFLRRLTWTMCASASVKTSECLLLQACGKASRKCSGASSYWD